MPVDTLFAEAVTLHRAGRLADALGLYGEILDRDPTNPDALSYAGVAAFQLGDAERGVRLLGEAISVRPGDAEAHNNLGLALQKLDRAEEAIAKHRRAVEISPDFADAWNNLGTALQNVKRLDDAVGAYRRVIEITPDYGTAHCNLGIALLERGDPAPAVEACNACLRVEPFNQSAITYKAFALDEIGEREAARSLNDFGRFVRPVRFTRAAGYDSLADFNGALARHVCAHPTLAFEPGDKATRFGSQSGELLAGDKGPVAVLEDMIQEAARDYRSSLPADPSHPFLAHKPRRWTLNVWATVLESLGHQSAHFHPAGWLSGVYYVQIPRGVSAGEGPHDGWIEFGRPPPKFPQTVEHEVHLCRPEEGLMVLFPSYMYHRTLPFEDTNRRISIAFDVVPKRSLA